MSFSAWYRRNAFWVAYGLAFLVLIPSIFWLASQIQYEAAYEDYATSHAQQQRQTKLDRDCFALAEPKEALDCLKEQLQPARKEQRAEEDLRAQKDMANWALGVLIVSFAVGLITIALTAVGIVLVRQTLAANREAAQAATKAAVASETANETARDTARKELRAYISVEPDGINWLVGRSAVLGHVIIRNVGKLPATNVSTLVNMTASNDRLFKPPKAEESDARGKRVMQPTVHIRQGSASRPVTVSPYAWDKPNTAFLYIWGIVYYDNGYDCRCFTTFCHRYATASRNETPSDIGLSLTGRSRRRRQPPYVDPEQARYHEHGNEAD